MAYSIELANRIRAYLAAIPNLEVAEKRMFSGLAFMVNGKMCINVSGENLMCRFDPNLLEELAEKRGFLPMIMKGKQMAGYCYVEPIGFAQKALSFGSTSVWILMNGQNLRNSLLKSKVIAAIYVRPAFRCNLFVKLIPCICHAELVEAPLH